MRIERRHRHEKSLPPLPARTRRWSGDGSGTDRRAPASPTTRERLADRLLREYLECERHTGD